MPCAPSPNVSPNPQLPFHRTLPGPPPAAPVALSFLDRSAFLRVAQDGRTCTTDRGYRSGRGSVAVREGTWYYEATIVRSDGASGGGRGSAGDAGNPHVRIGWGRREAGLDAPVGADAYGYAIRDVGGEKVHISRAKSYGRTFATGDVVGCLISLPPRTEPVDEEDVAYVRRWRIPLRYRGQLYFEMDEYPVTKEMEALVNREGKPPPAPAAVEDIKPSEPKKKMKKGAGSSAAEPPTRPVARTLHKLPGSYVSFFLNGEPLGTAFEDLYDFLPLPPLPGQRKKYTHAYEREREAYQYHDDGTLGYFPMVSCFGRGKVHLNFGPDFASPLPEGARPMCERWDTFRAEELVYDERDEAASAEKMRRDMASAAAPPPSATGVGAGAAPGSGAGTATPGATGTPPTSKRPSKKKKKATPAPGDATPRERDATGTPAAEHEYEHENGPGGSSPFRARSTPFEGYETASAYDAGATPAASSPPAGMDVDDVVDVKQEVNEDTGAEGAAAAAAKAEDENEGVRW